MIWSAAMFLSNVRYSIQFTWWVEFVVDTPTLSENVLSNLKESLWAAEIDNFTLKVWEKDWYATVLIPARLSNDQVNKITTIIIQNLVSQKVITDKDGILEFTTIGPSFGDYIKKSARTALIVGTIIMALYILFFFAWMRELVSPVMLGLITVVTMLFDVTIPAWAYGVFMWLNSAIQVDTVFIIALLTVMGYSVNDTIIIFDRVRENFMDKKNALEKGTIKWDEIFEMSIWQTMRRSIWTSLSTLVVVVAMYIFGTWVLKTFAFTLAIWVLAWTYSSIFLAAPMAYLASIKKLDSKKK